MAIYPVKPSLVPKKATTPEAIVELPESLRKPFAILSAMMKKLGNESGAEPERAYLAIAIKSFEDYQVRAGMDPGPGYYRPITAERKEGINQFYERTAMAMYNGFVKKMAGYAEKGDNRQKRMAALFAEAQK